MLNGHGSRLDEDQTFGQAIGTSTVPGRGDFFGGQAGNQNPPTGSPTSAPSSSRSAGAPRSSDVGAVPGALMIIRWSPTCRASRQSACSTGGLIGDYDRPGITQRDTWGTYLSGKAQRDFGRGARVV